MILTARQLEALRQLIVDHHTAFIANVVDPSLISEDTRARLVSLGLIRPKSQAKTIEDAYALGVIAGQSADIADSMSFEQLKQAIAARPIPLSFAERTAITAAKLSAGQYITGLGNRVAGQVLSRTMEATPGPSEAEAYVGRVRDVIANAVRDRKTLKQIKSDLGWATGDWTRDLERVANTELAQVMSIGTANKAVKDFGEGARMAKLHAPNCCKQCRQAYCVPGTDIPKIFTVAELESNGTNVGRKAAEWRPVLGPLHPHCRCVAQVVPPGMTFNAKGQMVASGDRRQKKSP